MAWPQTASPQFPRSRKNASGLPRRSEEHTSELQSQSNLVCRLLLEKKKICSRVHDTAVHVAFATSDTFLEYIDELGSLHPTIYDACVAVVSCIVWKPGSGDLAFTV